MNLIKMKPCIYDQLSLNKAIDHIAVLYSPLGLEA